MITKSFENLIKDYPHVVTVLAQSASFIYNTFEDISWSGFYIAKDNSLYLGPFNGKPACSDIPFSKGVCGTCASNQKTIIVPDVHKFPGHIACDEGALSEIVIPIFVNNNLYAVLDIDSYKLDRFSNDHIIFENIVKIIENKLNSLKDFNL